MATKDHHPRATSISQAEALSLFSFLVRPETATPGRSGERCPFVELRLPIRRL